MWQHTFCGNRTDRPLASGVVAMTLAALLAAPQTPRAAAQTCSVYERQYFPAPAPAAQGNLFGAAVAMNSAGDRALAGAPGNDQFGTNAGAVYAFTRAPAGGPWSIAQTLGAGQASAGDAFGLALAIDGDIAVIGAPTDSPSAINGAGSAFVFRLVGGVWTFEQQLVALDPNVGDNFGSSVAVSGASAAGAAILIGAPQDDQGASNAGAAYVFRYNGTNWTQEAKLIETGSALARRVGKAAALVGDLAIVTRGGSAEAALVFRRQGNGTWSQVQVITSPDGASGDQFAFTAARDAGTLVLGAPLHPQPSAAGAAYVFTENDVVFSFTQKLTAPDSAGTPSGARFGSAVAARGDALVIGAQQKRVVPFNSPFELPTFDAGGIYVFRNVGRPGQPTWALHFAGVAHPRYNFNTFADDNDGDLLGAAVALGGSTIIAGGPRMPLASAPAGVHGKTLFFDLNPSDCNADGVPDACDPDCNHNRVSDLCEIAAGASADCNHNSQPDECENGFDYLLDDGTGSFVIGAPAPGLDYIWLNHYTVQSGGQRITHIAVPWTSFSADGLPVTLLLYDDPNNDGDPHDATLLMSQPASSAVVTGLSGIPAFTIYRVPTTFVGNVGESFFLGAAMTLGPNILGPMADATAPIPPGSWRATAPVGQGNITHLDMNPVLDTVNYKWVLRGLALDCNGNGVWDQCDIANGTSLDADNNGVPDECQAPCPADIAPPGGNRVVNVDDLLAVILHWGACPSPCPPHCVGDVAPLPDGNCSVNVDDLLYIIQHWGACP